MTKSRTTAGKRNVQQQKREKAQAKRERKAARKDADPGADPIQIEGSEVELIEKLASLHEALEAGRVTPQVFEEARERIGTQLELIARLGQ